MQTQKRAAEIPATSLRRGRRPRAFETISAERTAHVIVDLQNGFVEPGAPVEVPSARLIMPNVNRIIREMRRSGGLNIFLRFTHDPGEAMPWIIPSALRPGPEGELVRKALGRGTDYWQLSGDLDVGADDLILDKTRYSVFIPGTCELQNVLQERQLVMQKRQPAPHNPFQELGLPWKVVLKSPCKSKAYAELVDKPLALTFAARLAQVRATLHAEYPYAVTAIDLLMRGLREGEPAVVKPVVLVGDFGCGKSRLSFGLQYWL